MKIETWNGYPIRFVEKDGEWWAVLKDITNALNIGVREVRRRLKDDVLSKHLIYDAIGRKQEMYIINEFGIYDTVFQSRKKEAEEFRYWVYDMLKQLRQASGLEGFQVFRMLDKEHQKEAMEKLKQSLKEPVRINFIKANTIANKAVSNKYGIEKMLKKPEMSPEMLVDRQELLDATVELMGINEKYHLDISISDEVYKIASGWKREKGA